MQAFRPALLIASLASVLGTAVSTQSPTVTHECVAEGYVKLGAGSRSARCRYVDAYYGPDAWKADAERRRSRSRRSMREADRLIRDCRTAARPAATR